MKQQSHQQQRKSWKLNFETVDNRIEFLRPTNFSSLFFEIMYFCIFLGGVLVQFFGMYKFVLKDKLNT